MTHGLTQSGWVANPGHYMGAQVGAGIKMKIKLNRNKTNLKGAFGTQTGRNGMEWDRTGRNRTGQNKDFVLCLVRTRWNGTEQN